MAKIFITYTHHDESLANQLAEHLSKKNHEIFIDNKAAKVGQDYKKVLTTALKDSDGVIAIITSNSIKSNYVSNEIVAIRAFIEENPYKKFLIPVIYGNTPIPSFIDGIYCIDLDETNWEKAINFIDQAISAFIGKRAAAEETEIKEQKRIETKAADYIEIATSALSKREVQHKWSALVCYIIGFMALIGGFLYAEFGIKLILDLKNDEYLKFILAIIKSIVIVGLLIACSKYTFSLGKSFMHESLKNADRLHAISFGQFYLKAFGNKVNKPEEIRDIFQHWNIDKSSAFSNLDSATYDPKLTESLVEIVKSLSNKEKSEK